MYVRILFIIFFSLSFNNGVFSQLNQSAIYFSLNSYRDKIEYENIDNDFLDINSKLYKANIGYNHKGKYEFSLNYIENTSNINNYYFNDKNSYQGLDFYYYINNIKKIPIDFKIGTNFISSNIYRSNSMAFCIYKELSGGGNYPVIPFLEINSTSYSFKPENYDGSFTSLSIGMHLKLNVDAKDNSILKDIIWISTHLNTTNNSHYFIGFDIGLYHPIK